MKYKVAEHKQMSFKGMAELLGMPYKTAHFRWRKGYSLSESLLLPVGAPKSTAQIKHGMHRSPEYAAWERMHSRCRSHPHYRRLGIVVCERWSKFEAFFADMGPHPAGLTLDRIDSKRNYEPGNCRWATHQEQSQNTSRNRFIAWRGESRCAAEWARILGKSEKTIGDRLDRGWTAEQALTLPAYARVK